jgi:hypothetical protein
MLGFRGHCMPQCVLLLRSTTRPWYLRRLTMCASFVVPVCRMNRLCSTPPGTLHTTCKPRTGRTAWVRHVTWQCTAWWEQVWFASEFVGDLFCGNPHKWLGQQLVLLLACPACLLRCLVAVCRGASDNPQAANTPIFLTHLPHRHP